MNKIFFSFIYLIFLSLNALDFPIQPALPMLAKYLDDHELVNWMTINSHEIHWRDKYKKIGIRYFSEQELEKLKITVNADGFLTYKGVLLPPGSYAYILSKEGDLFALARKDRAQQKRNHEILAECKKEGALFRKIVFKHSSLSLGKNLLAVGDFEIDTDGKTLFFSNDSGHYRLKSIYMKNLALYLQAAGIQEAIFHLYYKDKLNRVCTKATTLSEVVHAPLNSSIFTGP